MPSFLYLSIFKKSLPYFFITVVVLVGFFGFTEKTNAQFTPPAPLPVTTNVTVPNVGANVQLGSAPIDTNKGTCTWTVGAVNAGKSEVKTNVTEAECTTMSRGGTNILWARNGSTSMATAPKSTVPDDIDGCTWYKPSTWFGCIVSSIAGFVMMIAAFFLWLAGMILNFVLDQTIVKMSANVNGFTGINIAWKIIRDLMNIAFIFMLVWKGIQLILSLGSLDNIKKFIGMIILSSLLINFSLFFTKVMIDASNIVTIGIYDSIIDKKTTSTIPGSSGSVGTIDGGLSVPFMNAMGLTSIFATNTFSGLNLGGTFNIVIFKLVGALLFIIASFIFFAVSVLFVVRYVTLLFLLMLSPIAYMGMALPFMKNYADDWWKSFKGQLIFPPVYMLMTLIVLTLMTEQGFLKTVVSPGGAATTSPGFLSLIFNFTIIIGLMLFSLITAKKTASEGSALIKQATGHLTKFAGGVAMGGAGWAGRKTIGAAASRLSESQRLQNWAGRSAIGERALKMTRSTADSNFDVRSSRIGQKVASTAGVDLGEAQKGGFNRTLADKTANKEKFSKTLKGDVAKEAYATRQASGIFTRNGSNSSGNTVFGVMGRSNRVVASKLLNDQLSPLETKETELQNKEVQLSQQIANMNGEVSTITAAVAASTATPQQIARLAVLNAPPYQPAPPGSPPGTNGPANRNSLAYAQDQLNTTQTRLANTTNEVTRIRGVISGNGLVNTAGTPVVGTPTAGQTRRLGQLNNQLAMVNSAIALAGGTPSAAQQARLNNINTQIAGLQTAITATIAATSRPGNPALGVRNAQTGVVRGKRADEQNY